VRADVWPSTWSLRSGVRAGTTPTTGRRRPPRSRCRFAPMPIGDGTNERNRALVDPCNDAGHSRATPHHGARSTRHRSHRTCRIVRSGSDLRVGRRSARGPGQGRPRSRNRPPRPTCASARLLTGACRRARDRSSRSADGKLSSRTGRAHYWGLGSTLPIAIPRNRRARVSRVPEPTRCSLQCGRDVSAGTYRTSRASPGRSARRRSAVSSCAH